MTKIAFQGERGAFSEDAATRFFGTHIDFLPCAYLRDVFQVVLTEEVPFGMVPVENSQAGSINDTYDLLLSYPLNIFAELILRVHHCLMALPGQSLAEITIVYSHPQALAQCDKFLSQLQVETIPAYDTAGSAKMIKEKHLHGCAAIANSRAADIYGLEVLASGIETNPHNYTRFFAISKQKTRPARESKTSLVFAVKHVSGALYSILGIFAARNINLTKLESRPSRDKPWEYVFYADFEGHVDSEIYRGVIEELREKTTFLRLLGSYPKSEEQLA